MGKFQFQIMHKYVAVFLILLACHVSLQTQARKIKPLNTYTTLPTSSENKVLDSPMIPRYEVASFRDSKTDINAFRPTSPGGSPGVGHKSSEEGDDMKAMVVVQSPDLRVHLNNEGTKNGFKPTEPGHSPGVGHVYQNKNGGN
ncbi:hypothetical protein TanjilG_09396 [Lupinus angustifolius]|uniref:Encoded peptide n=1 Tax=Lupinus angustifolius TaxID=3871 RepID=A0A4P1RFE7_LUPAN|nr:PREDICTED: uncharacterized protein LOC109350928 [Lupinus angustifolius]OIW09723.1 hypothetical protein TanjilG_09396 [Lupinus angustifolius]